MSSSTSTRPTIAFLSLVDSESLSSLTLRELKDIARTLSAENTEMPKRRKEIVDFIRKVAPAGNNSNSYSVGEIINEFKRFANLEQLISACSSLIGSSLLVEKMSDYEDLADVELVEDGYDDDEEDDEDEYEKENYVLTQAYGLKKRIREQTGFRNKSDITEPLHKVRVMKQSATNKLLRGLDKVMLEIGNNVTVNNTLQNVKSELQTVKTKLETAETKLQTVESELQNTKTDLQNTKTDLQNTKTKLQTVETKLQIAEREFQSAVRCLKD
ncbi:hypothetical protein FDP41_005746 [Naegleria fowleri]|uniref:Uncharacterized protein n=1 Tax=Naegleria fowleri TaxID=5763 RepID=A0A6A5BAA9_NAEFO|nr:uncharacterized protein FDP41_005746 [Naegleria fowleri]KAF0974993.1 hypothetical protein FDP41_005746 [Naegleria fowleri]